MFSAANESSEDETRSECMEKTRGRLDQFTGIVIKPNTANLSVNLLGDFKSEKIEILVVI